MFYFIGINWKFAAYLYEKQFMGQFFCYDGLERQISWYDPYGKASVINTKLLLRTVNAYQNENSLYLRDFAYDIFKFQFGRNKIFNKTIKQFFHMELPNPYNFTAYNYLEKKGVFYIRYDKKIKYIIGRKRRVFYLVIFLEEITQIYYVPRLDDFVLEDEFDYVWAIIQNEDDITVEYNSKLYQNGIKQKKSFIMKFAF